jgi:hypothetical protein
VVESVEGEPSGNNTKEKNGKCEKWKWGMGREEEGGGVRSRT